MENLYMIPMFACFFFAIWALYDEFFGNHGNEHEEENEIMTDKHIPEFLAEQISDRTGIEDLHHEKGFLIHDCNQCKEKFLGNKHRFQCHQCAVKNTRAFFLMSEDDKEELKAAWNSEEECTQS